MTEPTSSHHDGRGLPREHRQRHHHSVETMPIIGWTEYVDFPDWGIKGLKAKVDTGARTSALHVDDLQDLGDGHVRFTVVTKRNNPSGDLGVIAPILKWAKVRSSTGIYRKRCFVTARVIIGPIVKNIELSLVSREKMLFRMLLGRKAIERDFLVDVSKRSVITAKPRKRKREASE